MAPMTLAEKLIARAAGRDSVRPGEIVTASVDLAMMHDSGGPRRVAPMLERLGAKVWNPDRVVLVSDHYVPAVDAESAAILDLTRKWAKSAGIARFHDMQGICHVVLPERGHLRPGMFAVGGDSHSPTGGAFGAYMFGVGATEMCGVLVTGGIWLRVPDTILLHWRGRLGFGRFGYRTHSPEALSGKMGRPVERRRRRELRRLRATLGCGGGANLSHDCRC